MFRHRFELILRPSRRRMDVAVLVTHKIEIAEGYGNGLCPDAEEASNINDSLTSGTRPMQMIQSADLLVVDAVDVRTLQIYALR